MKFLSLLLVTLTIGGAAMASDLGNILAPVATIPSNSPASQFRSSSATQDGPSIVTSQAVSGDYGISEREILDILQRELTARFSLEGELKLSFLQPWKSVEVKNSRDWKLVLDQVPNGGLTSVSQLRFHIEAGGKVVGDWQQSVRAQLWRPVWFSTRRLDRGEVPDSSICTAKTYDVLNEKLSLVPADTDLSIYEMAQTVSQERPLAWRDIALRPLVRKGQLIDVVVAEGALNISMKGIALGNGGAGENVSVRNIDSRKEFSARVVRPNTVQVKF